MKSGLTHRIVPRKLPDGAIIISVRGGQDVVVTQEVWSIMLDQVLLAEVRVREEQSKDLDKR